MGGSQMPGYTIVRDPLKQQPIPEDGILTRQLFDDESIRVVLFTFSSGQRLSEHTASTTALLHVLSGEATITLGTDTIEAKPGTWIRMDAGLAHSVITKTAVVLLLVLLKGIGRE